MQDLHHPSLLVLTIFVSTVLVSSAAFTGFSGLTLEKCVSNTDCKGNRRCYTLLSDDIVPCPPTTSTKCFCRPYSILTCTSSSSCDEGELCFNVGSRAVCISCAEVARVYPKEGTLVDGFEKCANLGVTGDYCKSATACVFPRTCVDSSNRSDCSFGKDECLCYPPTGLKSCTSCTDCTSTQESCFTAKSTSQSICLSEAGYKFTLSHTRKGKPCTSVSSAPTAPSQEVPTPDTPSVSPALPSADTSAPSTPSKSSLPASSSPSPYPTLDPLSESSASPLASSSPTPSASPSSSMSTSGNSQPEASVVPFVPRPSISAAPCIAVQHLTHLSPADLVFHAHRLAAVLCDAFGTCATAGHIIVFNGHAMRMTRYCALQDVQCVERRMHVNNPRMRRGRRVESMTKGLEFSVFAARYESWVEETILRAVVAVGM